MVLGAPHTCVCRGLMAPVWLLQADTPLTPLKCFLGKAVLSVGISGAGALARRPWLLLDAEKTNIVLETLIIERFSAQNWPALGELKIKTKTLPQADFLMNNSQS